MKRNKSIFKKFRIFDNFGAKASFNINGFSETTSIFGGITYFIFFMCSLAYVIFNIREFVLKENVKLNFSQKLLDSAPLLDLNHHKFNFSVRISDENNFMTNDIFEKHFNLDYQLISKKYNDNNKIVSSLKKRMCNTNDFNNKTFTKDITHFYCASYENISDYFITGNHDHSIYKYIHINLSLKNETLLRLDEIMEYLLKSNLKISVLISDCSVDIEEINDPINYSFSSFSSYIEFDFHKRIDVQLSEIQFFDDKNYFFIDPDEHSYFTINNIRDYSSSRYTKPDLFSIYIRSSRKAYIYGRIYQKLPNFVGDTTAILGEVLIILYFIISPINEKHLSQTIMNKVMKYGIVSSNKNEKQIDISNRESIKNNDNSYTINDINKSNLNVSKMIIEEKIERKEKVKLKSCKFLCARFCKCLVSNQVKKKLAIVDKCEEKISFYLNVLVYIRKMQELDVIKFLLLSSEHFKIFNFLAGPSILINDNPNNIYKQFRNQQEEIEFNMNNNAYEDITRSCEYLMGKENNDDLTKKLVNLFMDEVEHFKNQEN